MIKYIILLVVFFNNPAMSQRISVQAGLGLGVSSPGPKVRGMLHAAFYYNLSSRFSIGVEASNSGGLIDWPTGSKYGYDLGGNNLTLDPTNMHANALLGKVKYAWKTGVIKPYAELGLGTNTFFYKNPTQSIDLVESENFAFQPEVGIMLSKFQFSLCYFWGGSTPSVSVIEEAYPGSMKNISISMQSISIVALYTRVSYRFDFGKRKSFKR
jgi:hypothetical protein